VGPQGVTRYDTHAANWMYGMNIPVLDIWMWPRGDVPSLQRTLGLSVLGPEQF
jgi:hypothetical protein